MSVAIDWKIVARSAVGSVLKLQFSTIIAIIIWGRPLHRGMLSGYTAHIDGARRGNGRRGKILHSKSMLVMQCFAHRCF